MRCHDEIFAPKAGLVRSTRESAPTVRPNFLISCYWLTADVAHGQHPDRRATGRVWGPGERARWREMVSRVIITE